MLSRSFTLMLSARFFVHLTFLLTCVVFTFVWTKNPILSFYSLQAIAFLVLLYFINHFLGKNQTSSLTIDGLIFTMVTLLLVSQTGGLSSPLFFLLYLLLFGLSLFFETLPTVIFSLTLVLFFSGQARSLSDFIQIFSLILITPLAIFFGRQYLVLLEKEEKIQILKKKEEELTQEVIAQEEDTLMWLSLTFREHVMSILDQSSNLLADIAHLTLKQKESLQKIHESAKRLLKLGDKLKEKIEE